MYVDDINTKGMYVDGINTNVHLHTYFIVTNVFQIQKELEKHLTTKYGL